MKKINIGTEINLEDLLQSRLLIQANSGGGKSVIARVIVEETFGKVPFMIFDIEGEYYTLKERYGDILIIGGQHADVPINLKTAKLLAKEIIANQVSVIIDLSDLTMTDRILFVKYFGEAMMDLNREYWKQYLFFVEEAHKLCGEQDKQASAPFIKDLMSRGRKRGYCGVLITQRIAKLHKDAAAECNNKFIGRTHLDIDMDRAAKELGFSKKEDRLSLRDLQPGEFLAFGTAINPHHVHKIKIHLPKTKIPKAGELMDIKPKQPTEKIKSILAKLTAPVEVKKDLPILQKQFIGKTYETEYKQAVQQNNELLKELQIRDRCLSEVKKELGKSTALMNGTIHRIEEFGNGLPKREPMVFKTETLKKVNLVDLSKENVITPKRSDIGKCPYAILEFLGSHPDKAFSKAQIGVCICYSPNSGGFNNALAELNTRGLIAKEGSKIKGSDSIFEILGEDFQPKEYAIYNYAHKLAKCEREIYEVLLNNPRQLYSKEELGSSTVSNYSPNSGGFNNALSGLNTLELIERQSGKIKLNPELLDLM